MAYRKRALQFHTNGQLQEYFLRRKLACSRMFLSCEKLSLQLTGFPIWGEGIMEYLASNFKILYFKNSGLLIIPEFIMPLDHVMPLLIL